MSRSKGPCANRPVELLVAVVGGAGGEGLLGVLLLLELLPVCALLRYGLPKGLTLGGEHVTLVAQHLELAHVRHLIAKLPLNLVMLLTPVLGFGNCRGRFLGLLPQFGDLVRRRPPRELVAQVGELSGARSSIRRFADSGSSS